MNPTKTQAMAALFCAVVAAQKEPQEPGRVSTDSAGEFRDEVHGAGELSRAYLNTTNWSHSGAERPQVPVIDDDDDNGARRTSDSLSLGARRSTRAAMRVPVRLGIKEEKGTSQMLVAWTLALSLLAPLPPVARAAL